jgi:hypothetical protein
VNHLLLELTMVDPTKRREEIQDEITRLGKLQKEAIENAPEGSPTGNTAYEERARHISRLVSSWLVYAKRERRELGKGEWRMVGCGRSAAGSRVETASSSSDLKPAV